MNKLTLSALVLALSAGVVCADPQPGDKPAAEKPVAPAKIVKPSSEGDKKKDEAPATLKVGDKAPAITVDSWVKGDEVKSFESGKVYVVEFWATWCGPCIASIPHLTKIQKDHPELTVIGVAASERMPKSKDGSTPADTRLDGVKEFVKKQGEGMAYRVAFDGKRAMSKDWMQPANQKGIPCAFIVGHDGKLAYIGHPSKMDGELSKALKAAADAKKTALK
ncbi:MAG TPA: TlpA disulfide reductase family protein [Phycisphaerales bacterium]|nr:TlpA disulfide reductase family protein [Phycisphaerales bacterium]